MSSWVLASPGASVVVRRRDYGSHDCTLYSALRQSGLYGVRCTSLYSVHRTLFSSQNCCTVQKPGLYTIHYSSEDLYSTAAVRTAAVLYDVRCIVFTTMYTVNYSDCFQYCVLYDVHCTGRIVHCPRLVQFISITKDCVNYNLQCSLVNYLLTYVKDSIEQIVGQISVILLPM